MSSFLQMARQAADIAKQIAPSDGAIRQALVLGNLLPRLMVPAMKGIISAREQNAVLTHASRITNAATIGATGNATISVPTHGDFLWTKISVGEGDVPASGTYDFMLQLRFGRNDRNWVQGRAAGINPQLFLGDDSEPYPLTKAEYLPRNNVLNVTITALTANARSVDVDLFGVMQYDTNLLDNTQEVG